MYATQEARPHSQPGVTIQSTPPGAPTMASSADYNHAYPGYSTVDGYSYENSNYQAYNYAYAQHGNPPHHSQHMGGYESTTAPYQPVNTYTESTHYQGSSNYYNTPVPAYQNQSAYQHVNYQNQWNANSYANYAGYHGYQGYPQQDPNSTNQTVSTQYAPDYQQQWANYYASLQQNSSKVEEHEECTAPGTEPAVPEKKTLPYNQPPPPGTGWDLNEPSYPDANAAHAPQAGTSGPPENGGAFVPNPPVTAFHGEHYSHVQSNHFQQPPYLQQSVQDQPLQFQTSQDQHSIIQGQQFQAAQSHVPANTFQPKVFQSPLSDPSQRRPGKVQIPTNPRIVSSLSMATKSVSTDTSQVRKPAYVNVSAKTTPFKASSDATSDAMLQPGMFPPSLRAYVERALARCKDDAQKKACQEIMKEMITTASADGTLFTKNWDTEPLFPLPNVASTSGKDVIQSFNVVSPFSKQDRSPTKRSKSRWEPIAEAKLDEKSVLKGPSLNKDVTVNFLKTPETLASPMKWEKQENVWNKQKALLQQHVSAMNSSGQRVAKKARKDSSELNNSSEDSEADIIPIGGVCLGTLSTAETPEEKLKRQSRTKRFDKNKDVKTGNKDLFRSRMGIGVSASARRATALLLARSAGDGSASAVEDINWDALTVKGTCQEVEKRYLRLTSAPDPNTVRPEEVLKKALVMVQTTHKNYLYKCEQLKSIRQDLTVQRIRNELTVQVYETHARMALEAGDLPEYNQCQSQLKGLYSEGIRGCNKEFTAYNLLYIIFNHGNNRDLLSSMARLSIEDKEEKAIKHALAVRAAVAAGNYTSFFRLYRAAPNLSTCLMDLHVEKMRFEALRCMARAYRPTLQVSYLARILGFVGFGSENGPEKDQEGLEECEEWLKAHGAVLVHDNESELCVDCKPSSGSLFMPEPEDAVPHGDANLALNDFFAQV